MSSNDLDISVFYNYKTFPLILMPNGGGPITKDNLQIDDIYLQDLRVNRYNIKNFDINKFTSTLDMIFKKCNEPLKIRAVLMIFAFKNVIDILPIFGYIITEDKLKTRVSRREFDNKKLFQTKSRYFNDTFYNELARHPTLMLDVIETIYSFYSNPNGAQYEDSYVIINRIILANETSLKPLPPDRMKFMEEIHVGKFKDQIIKSFPIILPFSMKYRDYRLWYKKNYPSPLKVGFRIKVDRENVLNSVWCLDSVKDVNVPFRVKFLGESGVDRGGLTSEFIQLSFNEIFKPSSNLFDYRKDYYWFKPHNYSGPEEKKQFLKKYFCVGLLLGIAISLKVTIPAHFPPYFYKKLLHRNIPKTDLNLFDPVLFQALANLVNADIPKNNPGDYTYIDSMSQLEVDLTTFKYIPDDDSYKITPLTNANKATFMYDIARWVFDISIKDEFEAFENGFRKVRRDPFFYHFFRLDELDRIVSGVYIRNWNDLKNSAKYSGFTSESKTIVWFWKYFEGLNEDGKLRVLRFIRASASVPPGGLKDVHIKIKKVEGKGCPIAHTCFERLDLPEYDSYEELKEKCDLGFAYSESFGRR